MYPHPFLMARAGYMMSEIEHADMEEYVRSLESHIEAQNRVYRELLDYTKGVEADRDRLVEDTAAKLSAYGTTKTLLEKFVEYSERVFSSAFRGTELDKLSALVKQLP